MSVYCTFTIKYANGHRTHWTLALAIFPALLLFVSCILTSISAAELPLYWSRSSLPWSAFHTAPPPLIRLFRSRFPVRIVAQNQVPCHRTAPHANQTGQPTAGRRTADSEGRSRPYLACASRLRLGLPYLYDPCILLLIPFLNTFNCMGVSTRTSISGCARTLRSRRRRSVGVMIALSHLTPLNRSKEARSRW